MYIDMGDRIAGKQDRPSLIIEHPPQAPQIAQNIHIEKTGFQIVSPCCTYVSTVMRYAFADISVPPATPVFYVRAKHDPRKKYNYLFFSYFVF